MQNSRLVGFLALLAVTGPVLADESVTVDPALAMAKSRATSKPILVYVYDSG